MIWFPGRYCLLHIVLRDSCVPGSRKELLLQSTYFIIADATWTPVLTGSKRCRAEPVTPGDPDSVTCITLTFHFKLILYNCRALPMRGVVT